MLDIVNGIINVPNINLSPNLASVKHMAAVLGFTRAMGCLTASPGTATYLSDHKSKKNSIRSCPWCYIYISNIYICTVHITCVYCIYIYIYVYIYIYYTIRIICVDYIMCLVPKIGDPQVKICQATAGTCRFCTSQTDVLKVIPNGAKKNKPIGSMYAIYGDIYHQYTPNVTIYSIHGSYGKGPGLANAKGERHLFCSFFHEFVDRIWQDMEDPKFEQSLHT